MMIFVEAWPAIGVLACGAGDAEQCQCDACRLVPASFYRHHRSVSEHQRRIAAGDIQIERAVRAVARLPLWECVHRTGERIDEDRILQAEAMDKQVRLSREILKERTEG